MWEYVVGGVIAASGTAFALLNGWASAQEDRRREADEHAEGGNRSRAERPRAA